MQDGPRRSRIVSKENARNLQAAVFGLLVLVWLVVLILLGVRLPPVILVGAAALLALLTGALIRRLR